MPASQQAGQFCPLCGGRERILNQKSLERYKAMEKLYDAIDDLFKILYYEHQPEDD